MFTFSKTKNSIGIFILFFSVVRIFTKEPVTRWRFYFTPFVSSLPSIKLQVGLPTKKFLILDEPEDSLVYIQVTRNWTLSEASFISVRTLYPISLTFDSKLFFHLCEVYLLSFIHKVVSCHIRQVCNLLCLHRGSLKSQDVKYV
jgi:hypothetical protein